MPQWESTVYLVHEISGALPTAHRLSPASLFRSLIATTLCRMLIGVARDLGCQGIWLATEENNVAARALYCRLVARETGAIVVYAWAGAMDA